MEFKRVLGSTTGVDSPRSSFRSLNTHDWALELPYVNTDLLTEVYTFFCLWLLESPEDRSEARDVSGPPHLGHGTSDVV